MSKKQSLFEDGEEVDDTLKISKEFAEKYDYNKRRMMLDQAKEQYGQDLQGLEESSSSEDDSEAELINPKFEKKFFQLLTDIKNKDPKLKEIKESDRVFSDDDFEQSDQG